MCLVSPHEESKDNIIIWPLVLYEHKFVTVREADSSGCAV